VKPRRGWMGKYFLEAPSKKEKKESSHGKRKWLVSTFKKVARGLAQTDNEKEMPYGKAATGHKKEEGVSQ